MGYFTYRTKPPAGKLPTYIGEDGVREYTVLNVMLLRNATGDPSVPIHCIGGVADNTDSQDMMGFVKAVAASQILYAYSFGPALKVAQSS